MPISINWGSKVIYVPQNYLTLVSGVLYELNMDQFRLDLKALEDDEAGMPFQDTHRHVTEIVLSGVTYARFIEIINGYTVEFEDGQYVVSCVGANHNLADVKVANQVSLIIGNSAGLIVSETGVSGLTPEESEQLLSLPDADEVADSVWNELMAEHSVDGSFGNIMSRILDTSEIEQCTVQDTGASTTKFITSLTGVNGFWDRAPILFTSGQCADQARGIKTSKSNGEITLETPLSHAPANGDKFVVFVGRKFLAPDMDRVLGLAQENFRVKSQVYDDDGNLTTATVRIYGSAADAQNDVNPIAEYAMTATFSGPAQCTGYLMKQVV